jgi:6-phosphogluconolactonase
MNAEPSFVVSDGVEQLGAEAAGAMLRAIAAAIADRGLARIALSGGTTPLGAYTRLARANLEPARTRWFWDERAAEPDSARSNYAQARRHLLDPGRIDPDHVFRMRGEDPPEQAAAAYAELLLREFGLPGQGPLALDTAGRCSLEFDLIVAGMGADGHTASLFPRTQAVACRDRAAMAVQPGGTLEPRISLTRPVLISARRCVVLCAGAPGDEDEVPARLFQAAQPGTVTWFVDRAAAGQAA